jgi:hypothetical protein
VKLICGQGFFNERFGPPFVLAGLSLLVAQSRNSNKMLPPFRFGIAWLLVVSDDKHKLKAITSRVNATGLATQLPVR